MSAPVMFDFTDYKAYLEAFIEALPGQGRGFKTKLAEAAKCQGAYISQVLGGSAHFNLEQADAVNGLLEHKRNEARYFLLLTEFARASTPSLQEFLMGEIRAQQKEHSTIKGRVSVGESVSYEDQGTYYSRWYYSAIHMILTLPEYRTPEVIARGLRLGPKTVERALEFLAHAGLATKKDDGSFVPGNAQVFAWRDSPWFVKNTQNWRMQAIRNLEEASPDSKNLNFSAVFTLSVSDLERVREKLLKAIEETTEVVKSSPEERMACLNIDLFRLT